ncbi:hypothetical protein [Paenibacillus sediminis]|uniref:Uncharacterized protein n=1 Tax=Paenibacillus sediminis TaxID=664909 RepID=A0ABS4H6N0_9BACL|nr:hypothetical protein [Paenibacillus sediminis]MBP1938184.1 hypothetical protein [Paenibacillus sediminis]
MKRRRIRDIRNIESVPVAGVARITRLRKVFESERDQICLGFVNPR